MARLLRLLAEEEYTLADLAAAIGFRPHQIREMINAARIKGYKIQCNPYAGPSTYILRK